MRAMLDLHLLNVCTAVLLTLMKLLELVQPGNWLSTTHLKGTCFRISSVHLTGYIGCKHNNVLSFWPLKHFHFHWDRYA